MNSSEYFMTVQLQPHYIQSWLFGYGNSVFTYCEDFFQYLVLLSFGLSNFLGIYLIVGVFTYILLCNKKFTAREKKKVLFVISHPDDECMFFGPTILRLKETCDLNLLCLSNGDFYKQGLGRKQELWNACKILGIPDSNITLMSNTRMPDHPSYMWNSKRISRIVLDHIESKCIDEVYTFDINGVSGHLNHISIFYAFAHMCLRSEVPSYCRVFFLDSVNILRKYSFFLDATLSSSPLSKNVFIVNLLESAIIRKAMQQHKSQYLWYRRLYIYASRYTYLNTYKELELEDVQLQLQISDYEPPAEMGR